MFDIIRGTSYAYSTDYTVSGATLTWSGLGLDGTIATSDVIRLIYPI